MTTITLPREEIERALEALENPHAGLVPHNGEWRSIQEVAISAIRARLEKSSCWCETCRPVTMDDMRFVVCPDCGNKRCPKATDHRNECTNSNEPGQPGSSHGRLTPAAQPEQRPEPVATGKESLPVRTFTMFRRNVPTDTHDENQRNAPDEPQFEGAVFSDGRVAIRWLTAKRSVSVWDCLDDMLAIHGHPEYGSELVWHASPPPRQELSEEEIYNIWGRRSDGPSPAEVVSFARAIERKVRG